MPDEGPTDSSQINHVMPASRMENITDFAKEILAPPGGTGLTTSGGHLGAALWRHDWQSLTRQMV